MMLITKKDKLFLTLAITLISLLMVSINSFAANDNAKVYKWKDSADKWHYSKLPPNSDNKKQQPDDLEIAKDAKTIIFEKQTNTVSPEIEELAVEQKERQLRLDCQLTQTNMMETANFYRKEIDKKLQEKNITQEEYQKETLSINKLEEISSDINFYDYCIADFTPKPQFKSISHCIQKNSSLKSRASCLKELPQTE